MAFILYEWKPDLKDVFLSLVKIKKEHHMMFLFFICFLTQFVHFEKQ
jgi:hypothetical protein